jgi:hypothetical protein
MPSSTPKQARFMAAIAHGMKPRKGGPSVKVAKDFLKADERSGKYEHSRHKHTSKQWSDSKPLPRKNGGPVVGKKHWMQGAVKPSHKGLFTAKANAAGKSVHEYAVEKKHAKGKLGKEARLALVFEHHH